jgi:hypothetical protein
MVQRARWWLVICLVLSTGCAGSALEQRPPALSAPALSQRRAAALPAIAALQEGRFDDAGKQAGEQLGADAANPYARLVRAIVRYKKSMHQLALDLRTVGVGLVGAGGLNQKYLRTTLEEGEAELAAVEADLLAISGQPDLSVELCLACWDIDWNANGRVDSRDRRLLEIEEDASGEPIPEGDPRRRPTFRFDAGDVAWARAFVSFQRAALDVVIAYDWSDLSRAIGERGGRGERSERPDEIVIHLTTPARVTAARERILEGLDHSDEARRSYLAETDDDREWVPSPRQKSHPVPLPVDQALYDTWEGVLGDVRRLVHSEEGVHLAEVFQLAGERVDPPPRGYLDLGSMLSRPRDLRLDVGKLKKLERGNDVEGMLEALLGDHYVPAMKPSPLPRRLLRMKGEMDSHQEAFGRKLRYLFWLN